VFLIADGRRRYAYTTSPASRSATPTCSPGAARPARTTAARRAATATTSAALASASATTTAAAAARTAGRPPTCAAAAARSSGPGAGYTSACGSKGVIGCAAESVENSKDNESDANNQEGVFRDILSRLLSPESLQDYSHGNACFSVDKV
jgi:hypothetical protein